MALISQTTFFGTPFWKVFFIKNKIFINCFISFITFLYLPEMSDPRSMFLPAKCKMNSSYTFRHYVNYSIHVLGFPVLESFYPFSHHRSRFASFLTSKTKVAHSKNKFSYSLIKHLSNLIIGSLHNNSTLYYCNYILIIF